MPKNSVMDPAVLIDDLVGDLVDDLRGDLHPQFGIRPFRAVKVIRHWSGPAVGDGTYLDEEEEVLPQPSVSGWDGMRWRQNFCGLEPEGSVRLTEVSLQYAYDDLVGGGSDSDEVFWRLDEAYGQGQPQRWFRLEKEPYPDREHDIGWVVHLRRLPTGGAP